MNIQFKFKPKKRKKKTLDFVYNTLNKSDVNIQYSETLSFSLLYLVDR